ncbi:MAG: type 4a pilus biogenesis protein PilO [Candidatus Aminicenantaceae bacterium]
MKDWPWYGHVALALVAVVILYIAYFKPKNAVLNSLREEKVTAEENLNRLKGKKRHLDKIEAELVTISRTLKELEAIIPDRKEVWDVLRNMHQLALDSRLNIAKFQPQREVNKEFYFEWPIPVEITGNFHNLARFFDRLSNFSRLFNIEDFSIKALSKQTEDDTITAAITAKTYIFREEPPEPKAKKGKKGGK